VTAAATAACGVTLPDRAVTPQARRRYDWAKEVSDLLTAALARDDERNRIRCPRCGRRLDDT